MRRRSRRSNWCARVACAAPSSTSCGGWPARRRALARLGLEPALVLVDGLPCPELGRPHDAIVDGDACCHSIAAASVIAKTVRDRLMELLGARHPLYAWASNKGYGTPDHLAALAAFGFTSHHRKSLVR